MKKKEIKRAAHTTTYIAVWWTLFSAFGVFDWIDARRYIGGPDSFMALTIWGIHLLIIGFAIHAWRTEKPQDVLWIGDDDEFMDVKPEDFNAEGELKTLKKRLISEVLGTMWLIAFAVVSTHFSSTPRGAFYVPGVLILFGGLMALNIIGSVARYLYLVNRARKAQK